MSALPIDDRDAMPSFPSAAVEFANGCAQLLALLASGANGSQLALVLKRTTRLVERASVRLEIDGDDIRANLAKLAPEAARVWRVRLASHGIRGILVSDGTSQRELLHFLVLLSGPADERAFHRVWMHEGAWRIQILSRTDQGASPGHCFDAGEVQALIDTWEHEGASASTASELPTEALRQLAGAVRGGVAAHEESPVGRLLRRGGARATAVLLEELTEATSGSQRRRLFEALVELRDGVGHLLEALQAPQWFIVRNAALLLGELQLESAVAPLGRLLRHHDVRVRTAATTALAQLPSADADPLIALAAQDDSPEVRAAAWRGWSGGRAAPPLQLLAHGLTHEPDCAVQLALLRCAAAFPDLDTHAALVRYCARELSAGAACEHILFAVELLARRNPSSARPFLRRLADRPPAHLEPAGKIALVS
jgi:hypothetical protein